MPDAKSAVHLDKTAAPSYGALLRQRSAWGTCMAMFGHNYVTYFLLTWLPFYLVRERHFSMYSMARIGGAAYLMGACLSIAAGWTSDYWIRAGATPTRVRKTIVAGGLAGAGVFLLLSAISTPYVSVALLMMGIGCQCISSSNIWAITQTLAGPYAAGRWTGLQNFVGNLAGVVAPAVTGFVLELLLAICDSHSRGSIRHFVLALPGRTSSRSYMVKARIGKSAAATAPLMNYVRCRPGRISRISFTCSIFRIFSIRSEHFASP